MAGILRIHARPYAIYGRLFATGYNFDGQLGLGDRTNRSSPVQVGSAADWLLFQAADAVGFGLRSGTLWAWGDDNGYGTLGDGTRANKSSPVQIGSDSDWVVVNGGPESLHAGGIRSGKLFTWGLNANGQLGLGNTINRSSPAQVGAATDWTNVVTGSIDTLALRDGALFGMGFNASGELGLGDRIQRNSPVQVGGATDWSVIALCYQTAHGIRNGALFGWGLNTTYGQIGDGTTISKSSPVQIGAETDWTAVVRGFRHTMGLRGGKLFVWGNNGSVYGQLGIGASGNVSSPVQVGSESDWSVIGAGEYHSFGIRNGKLFAWGYNNYGQLGLGNLVPRSSPVQVGSLTDWKNVKAGSNFSFAVR